MRFLKVRAVINGSQIYHLPKKRSITIPVESNNPSIVITDGIHFTKPLEVVFHHIHTYYFKVVCAIDDFQLLAGLAFIAIAYTVGFFSGILIIQLISFFPIFYFLYLFYINKDEFLQLTVT